MPTPTPHSPHHQDWLRGYEAFVCNPLAPPQITSDQAHSANMLRAGWNRAQQDRLILALHEPEIQ